MITKNHEKVVISCLEEIKKDNKQVYFIANSGNAGDCLINTATYQVLDNIGLGYIELDSQKINVDYLQGKVVLLGGGGGFVDNYQHMKDLVILLMPIVSHLVVLPQTIRGHGELISSLPDSVTLIVREKESYEYVLAQKSKAQLLLSCDMALLINITKIHPCSIFKLAPKKVLRYYLSRLKIALVSLFNNKQLHAMRQDSEQTDIPLKYSNLDMSELLALGTQNRRYNDFVSFQFLKCIHYFKEVHSNRLHVCIASYLLGLPTFMYDNNYGKNKNVYDHSLNNKKCITYKGIK